MTVEERDPKKPWRPLRELTEDLPKTRRKRKLPRLQRKNSRARENLRSPLWPKFCLRWNFGPPKIITRNITGKTRSVSKLSKKDPAACHSKKTSGAANNRRDLVVSSYPDAVMLSEAKHLWIFPFMNRSRFAPRFFASLRMTSRDGFRYFTAWLEHWIPKFHLGRWIKNGEIIETIRD